MIMWTIRRPACLGFSLCRPVSNAFTLIEILIVVIVLGILASIAIPSIQASREETANHTFATNIRYACGPIQMYNFRNGAYPPDRNPGEYPAGLEHALGGMDWTGTTPIGGQWDWDYNVFGITAAVSVHGPDNDTDQMAKIDAILDNGNLANGAFRIRSGGYMLVIAESP